MKPVKRHVPEPLSMMWVAHLRSGTRTGSRKAPCRACRWLGAAERCPPRWRLIRGCRSTQRSVDPACIRAGTRHDFAVEPISRDAHDVPAPTTTLSGALAGVGFMIDSMRSANVSSFAEIVIGALDYAPSGSPSESGRVVISLGP